MLDLERFAGIMPPMVTPFTADEELDEDALRREARLLLAAGVHGLCVGGSTGEGHTLTAEETCRAVRAVRAEVAAAGSSVPVIAGIIRDSTREVVRYGLALREAGADALQITPVHYLFHPGEAGNIAFYARIAGEVDLPLIIYNVVPWNSIQPDTLLQLAEIPRVIGVKQSGGDIHKLADLLRVNAGRLRIFSAVDDLLYPSFMLGADGAIAAILTILPRECVQLWDACRRGDHDTARALHERILPVWRAVGTPDMSTRVKAALDLLDRPCGPPRHPLLPAGAEARAEIAAALGRWQVVGGRF